MNDVRRVFVQGALCGACAATGFLFIMFWRITTSSRSAGAMVDGQFQPYQDDPSWYLMMIGGALMIAVGIGMLIYTWRRLPS